MLLGTGFEFYSLVPFLFSLYKKTNDVGAKLALFSCMPPPPAMMDYFSLDLQSKKKIFFPSCSFPGYFISITRKETNHSSHHVQKQRTQKFFLWPPQQLVPQDYHADLSYHCVCCKKWWKSGCKGKAKLTSISC